VDGGNTLRKITNDSAAYDYEPSWSPDNSHLIYARSDTAIYAASLLGFGGDGSTHVVDRHNNGEVFPRGAIAGTISPDGQWVAYSARDDSAGPIEIKVIPISGDTSQRRKLTKLSGTEDWYPQWSPDGTSSFLEDAR
jgi:Tol biopolymer transport system component